METFLSMNKLSTTVFVMPKVCDEQHVVAASLETPLRSFTARTLDEAVEMEFQRWRLRGFPFHKKNEGNAVF